MNPDNNTIENTLKEESDKAIERGFKVSGYFGKSINEFSQEQLIMLLNIINDKFQTYVKDTNEILKTLVNKTNIPPETLTHKELPNTPIQE